ncbi:Clp protease N-terminal domain-containing protein [Nocardia arizonensis]|uniref:Clp protease N-terminal domain-containing protein n=1 Tax=Nocardia arizonensis TaxID=1141647 RepID=UPI0006D25C96|nr:Clp protease N-terminal domain-containing protein [Nocardia arizonensis]
MSERDESTTTITPWVTVSLEKILLAAAEFANEHAYNYLAEEHLLAAVLADPRSFLAWVWPKGEALTLEQLRQVVLDNLPPVQAATVGTDNPVTVTTVRTGPVADELARNS